MNKYIISYRYYPNPNSKNPISPVNNIEVVTNEKIHYDGPGLWKTKCISLICNQTGISGSQVLDDSNFKVKFVGEVNEDNIKNNENKKGTSNTKKSIFVPLWAFPFKLIWRIIKLIFFFL